MNPGIMAGTCNECNQGLMTRVFLMEGHQRIIMSAGFRNCKIIDHPGKGPDNFLLSKFSTVYQVKPTRNAAFKQKAALCLAI